MYLCVGKKRLYAVSHGTEVKHASVTSVHIKGQPLEYRFGRPDCLLKVQNFKGIVLASFATRPGSDKSLHACLLIPNVF